MIAPTVHGNGTSSDELVFRHREALDAIRRAMHALEEAAPNARDFYPQGQMAYSRAARQHYARVDRLQAVAGELENELVAILDQVDL